MGTVIPDRDSNGHQLTLIHPFASKRIPEGNLFKRVKGYKFNVAANETKNLDIVIDLPTCKFSGAQIIGGEQGDQVDFKILDTNTNTVSGLDVNVFGANFPLNQFGFDVVIPSSNYSNTSDYDADLFAGLVVRCVYKNSTATAKTIGINLELHEVKA